jgi:hypothetical protein
VEQAGWGIFNMTEGKNDYQKSEKNEEKSLTDEDVFQLQ